MAFLSQVLIRNSQGKYLTRTVEENYEKEPASQVQLVEKKKGRLLDQLWRIDESDVKLVLPRHGRWLIGQDIAWLYTTEQAGTSQMDLILIYLDGTRLCVKNSDNSVVNSLYDPLYEVNKLVVSPFAGFSEEDWFIEALDNSFQDMYLRDTARHNLDTTHSQMSTSDQASRQDNLDVKFYIKDHQGKFLTRTEIGDKCLLDMQHKDAGRVMDQLWRLDILDKMDFILPLQGFWSIDQGASLYTTEKEGTYPKDFIKIYHQGNHLCVNESNSCVLASLLDKVLVTQFMGPSRLFPEQTWEMEYVSSIEEALQSCTKCHHEKKIARKCTIL